MTADPSHIEAHVKRGRDVEADEMHQRDRRSRGPEHLEHRVELLAVDEALALTTPRGLYENHAAHDDHDQGQPEWKDSASSPVRPPPEAEPNGIEKDDAAEQHQHRCRNEFCDAHRIYFLSRPPLAIKSRWSCSFSSTPFADFAPVA